MNDDKYVFNLGVFQFEEERYYLNVLRHARDQEILVLLHAELLRASGIQEVILEEVICAHT